MKYYSKWIGTAADLEEVTESLQEAIKEFGNVIAVENVPLGDDERNEWQEISKVELLIEIHKGTPIMKWVNDNWVRTEL